MQCISFLLLSNTYRTLSFKILQSYICNVFFLKKMFSLYRKSYSGNKVKITATVSCLFKQLMNSKNFAIFVLVYSYYNKRPSANYQNMYTV